MTKKHAIYFFFWKIMAYFLGVKKGVFVEEYSDHKQKFITGVITHLTCESITKNKCGFDIQVKWFEPFQGNDYRYYSDGSYSLKDFNRKIYFK